MGMDNGRIAVIKPDVSAGSTQEWMLLKTGRLSSHSVMQKPILALQLDGSKNILARDLDINLYCYTLKVGGEYEEKILTKSEKAPYTRMFGKFLLSNFKRDFFYHHSDHHIYHIKSNNDTKAAVSKYSSSQLEKLIDADIEDLPVMNAILYTTNKKGDIHTIRHLEGQLLEKVMDNSAFDNTGPSASFKNADYYFIRTGPENHHLIALVGQNVSDHVIVARVFRTHHVAAYTATSSLPGHHNPVKLERLHDFVFQLDAPDTGKEKEFAKDTIPQYVNFKCWHSLQTQRNHVNVLLVFLVRYHSFFVGLLKKSSAADPYTFSSHSEKMPEDTVKLKVAYGTAPPVEKYSSQQTIFLLFRSNSLLRLKLDLSKF